MAVPEKYKELGSSWEYSGGRKTAPYPTLFVGGNHEAINYLRELYFGGWAAPNIYFLGYSGVVQFGGIRIGGVSGIYKSFDYVKPHFELPPYSPSSIKSAYHVRASEIVKLSALEGGKLDVFVSHVGSLSCRRVGVSSSHSRLVSLTLSLARTGRAGLRSTVTWLICSGGRSIFERISRRTG